LTQYKYASNNYFSLSMKKIIAILFILCTSTIIFAQIKFSKTTLSINGKKYVVKIKEINEHITSLAIYRNQQQIMLDTIGTGGLYRVTYPDFNNDNCKDILLSYIENNNTYDLYLFDPAKRTFKKIRRFDSFPEAQPLKTNAEYYYSYHRAGCADYNWVSDLFIIRDFRIIHIGHINGLGCDINTNHPEDSSINIYRIPDNNENCRKLLKKLPYLKYIPEFEDKWAFIEKYWNKNYENFY
jgi:uncharacterized protein YlzI (FlbEa/FlbD family)